MTFVDTGRLPRVLWRVFPGCGYLESRRPDFRFSALLEARCLDNILVS